MVAYKSARNGKQYNLERILLSKRGEKTDSLMLADYEDWRGKYKYSQSDYGEAIWRYIATEDHLTLHYIHNNKHLTRELELKFSPEQIVPIKGGLCLIQNGEITVFDHNLNKKSYTFKYGRYPELKHSIPRAYADGNTIKLFWMEMAKSGDERANRKYGQRELHTISLSFEKFELSDNVQEIVTKSHQQWVRDNDLIQGVNVFYEGQFDASDKYFERSCKNKNEHACYWLYKMRYLRSKDQVEKEEALGRLRELVASGNLLAVRTSRAGMKWMNILNPEIFNSRGVPSEVSRQFGTHEALMGDPMSIYGGVYHIHRSWGPGNTPAYDLERQKEGRGMLERVSSKGHKDAQLILSEWLYKGIGGEPDKKRSESILKSLASEGHIKANLLLKKSPENRFAADVGQRLIELAEAGDPIAIEKLARDALDKKDYDLALSWMKRASKVDEKYGETYFAHVFADKNSPLYDKEKGLQLFKKLAKRVNGFSPVNDRSAWRWAQLHPNF